MAGYTDEHRQLAETLGPRTLEVLELNREDACVDYTRGQRRPLPPFAEKQAAGECHAE